MKALLFCFEAIMLAALPCRADVMSFSSASGTSGSKVSLLLSIDPQEQVTNFDCTFEYDNDLLTLNSVSLSDDAQGNNINQISCDESTSGNVHVYTASDSSWWTYDISELATLEFTISSAATSTSTQVKFVGSYYYTDKWYTADTQDGSIKISATTTPTPTPPTGTRPVVRLQMESALVFTCGGEPVISYSLEANDWEAYHADAYLAISLPNGALLYRDSHGNLTARQTPIVGNMILADSHGNLSFGALPGIAPQGLYTIYCTLATVGKSPLKEAYRVSNVDSTQFQLVPGTPTPHP